MKSPRPGKHLLVSLPPGWHRELKIVAAKEERTLKNIVTNALKPIVKSGKSGMNGSGKVS